MKLTSRMACMLAATALAGGLTMAMTGSAGAEVIPPTDTWAEIYTPYTNAHPVCLDDPNGTSAPGTPQQVFHCHGYGSDGAPQRWDFGHFGSIDGRNLYVIYKAGRCLGVDPGVPFAGERVKLVKCGPLLGPFWNLISLGTDSAVYPDFELDAGGGYCITLPDWSGRNAEPVVLEPCDPGNFLQHWILG
jgi:hypothetical protein